MYVNQCIRLEGIINFKILIENYFNLYGEIVKHKRVENDLREELKSRDDEIDKFKKQIFQKDQIMK